MSIKLRDFAKYLLIITIFIVGGFLVWKLREQIGLITLAAFLAVVLNPITDWLLPKMPRNSRLLAALCTYAIIVAIGLFLLAVILAPLVGQASQIAQSLPSTINRFLESDSGLTKTISNAIGSGAYNTDKQIVVEGVASLSYSLLVFLKQIASNLFSLGMLIGLSFFFLLEGAKIANFLKATLYPKTRSYYAQLADHTTSVIARYIGGNFLISGIAGSTTLLFLLLINAPFAFVLSVVVAICDLIPLVGAGIGAVIVAIILGLTAPQLVLPTILFLVVYQQIENNILAPVIYKKMVYISPLLSFIAVIIGSALAGVLGALIAVPLVGVAQIIVNELLEANLPHYKNGSKHQKKLASKAKN